MRTPLLPYGACPLLNQVVTAGLGNHRLMVDVSQARDLPNRSSVALELIGMNDLWNVIFT